MSHVSASAHAHTGVPTLGNGKQAAAVNEERQWNRFSHPAGPLAARLEQQQTSSLISVTDTQVCGHLQSKQTLVLRRMHSSSSSSRGRGPHPREGGRMPWLPPELKQLSTKVEGFSSQFSSSEPSEPAEAGELVNTDVLSLCRHINFQYF